MVKVVLLGAGNLGYHLTKKLLSNHTIELIQVYNRSISEIEYLEKKVAITNNILQLKEADIYIICVSDNAIAELSSKINAPNKLVVHTSGSMPLDELKSTSNKGVLYFLQSFSKNVEVDFSNIPITIEASTENEYQLLETMAAIFSDKCYRLNSDQRKTMHLAAVFVNNFTNHIYQNAFEICEENNIPFEILHPLIKETSEKIQKMTPFNAQTGPAKRNDTKTIEKHIAMLSSTKKEIYTLLSKSIQDTYGKKL
ncbi:MAG: DUF2520 domain-containing protein [Lutibacter sp.]|nr:DUF2520 domain-containing protein [Lutibacter sp.]